MNKLITILALMLLTLCTVTLKAVEHPKSTVKTILLSGKIQDSGNNETLAGVKISCVQCHKIIYSGLDGTFVLYLEVNSTENVNIEFSQVGYTTKTLSTKEFPSFSANLDVKLVSE